MDVRDAVIKAKDWVRDILADENVSNIGLEEIERDEAEKVWHVTIGFSRSWNGPRNALSTLADAFPSKRAYRVITVSEPDGEIISMKLREGEAA